MFMKFANYYIFVHLLLVFFMIQQQIAICHSPLQPPLQPLSLGKKYAAICHSLLQPPLQPLSLGKKYAAIYHSPLFKTMLKIEQYQQRQMKQLIKLMITYFSYCLQLTKNITVLTLYPNALTLVTIQIYSTRSNI